MQKIDLLSASRCNLLSSTLAAYQQALLKFWENTSRTMTQVSEQFKGLPTYQFQMLKSLNPLTIDNESKEHDEEGKEAKPGKESEEEKKQSTKDSQQKEEAPNEDDDDELISLDQSPIEEKTSETEASEETARNGAQSLIETDLLGDGEEADGKVNPRHEPSAFVDLLGGDDLMPSEQHSGTVRCHLCHLVIKKDWSSIHLFVSRNARNRQFSSLTFKVSLSAKICYVN